MKTKDLTIQNINPCVDFVEVDVQFRGQHPLNIKIRHDEFRNWSYQKGYWYSDYYGYLQALSENEDHIIKFLIQNENYIYDSLRDTIANQAAAV